jgi:hypothetical protein
MLYHAAPRVAGNLEGQVFHGALREYLSDLMGGPVGFCYTYLPEGWVGQEDVYELDIDPDTYILVAVGFDMLPRSPKPFWADGKLYHPDDIIHIVRVGDAAKYSEYEAVFLADGNVRFGKRAPVRTAENADMR